MSQGIPQEGTPIIPTETEVALSGHAQEIVEVNTPHAERGPVVYFPKEMPTDPEEYKRVLESIYAQAGNIVEDRAHMREIHDEYKEFDMVKEAEKENRIILAEMNADEQKGLGLFSRLGNWIRGDK